MEYLIAVDLEGVNFVKGDAYVGLGKEVSDYKIAIEQAVLEINSAINALFDGGATKVVVWDNHGGGNNIDFSKIDARAEKQPIIAPCVNRFEFCKNYNFVGCVFIGYHSKEGSIDGVLAHTYNSSAIQYFKIGGKAYGEFEIDASIASEYGIKPLFASGDSVFIEQVKEFSPETETVITKTAISRNEAIFNDNKEVLSNVYNGVLKAIKKDIPFAKITDSLNTTWGRRRPPILICFLPMVVSYIMCWMPLGLYLSVDSYTQQIINTIWIVFFSLIFFSTYTMCLIAFYGSLS